MESIKEKLRQIAELAKQGDAGEATAAQAMLEKLCAKHGITLDELLDDERRPVEFKVRGLEKKLLMRVACWVCGTYEIPNTIESKLVTLWLTRAQEVDVREAFGHYVEAWRKYLGEALDAFTVANKLFPPRDPNEDPTDDSDVTDEDRYRAKRVAMMAMGTWKTTFRKSLPGAE